MSYNKWGRDVILIFTYKKVNCFLIWQSKPQFCTRYKAPPSWKVDISPVHLTKPKLEIDIFLRTTFGILTFMTGFSGSPYCRGAISVKSHDWSILGSNLNKKHGRSKDQWGLPQHLCCSKNTIQRQHLFKCKKNTTKILKNCPPQPTNWWK